MKKDVILTDLRLEDKLSRHLTKHGGFVSIVKLCFFLVKRRLLSFVQNTRPSFSDQKQHISFEIAGGLGDFCMHAKYISAFYHEFGPDIVIDIITDTGHLGILRLIFSNCTYVADITDRKRGCTYDLYIRLVRFPEIRYYVPSRLNRELRDWVKYVFDFFKKNRLLLINDFLGRSYSEICGKTRETQADIGDFLHLRTNDNFRIHLRDVSEIVLTKFNLKPNEFIIIQTGPGHAFKNFCDVRQWPIIYYQKLIKLIKQKCPKITIVQTGFDYHDLIAGVDSDLRGKTTEEELLILLKEAKLLISQEGGCAIARHFISKKPSCVLFGPTSKEFFGFTENINLSANACPGCEWVTRDWIDKCMKTGDKPECMNLLTPEKVYKEMEVLLHE